MFGLAGDGARLVLWPMWSWRGDGRMAGRVIGVAAPAGAVIYCYVRPVADATG